MAFATPTTKNEMYSILKDIFYYYRVKRQSYNDVSLRNLALERLEFTPLTQSQIETQAQTLTSASQYEYKTKYLDDLDMEIAVINAKITALTNLLTEQIIKINEDFDKSSEKINSIALANGLGGSSIMLDKTTQLETEKNNIIANLQSETQIQINELKAKRTVLQSKLDSADSYCEQLAEKVKQAKVVELTAKQEDAIREVFKYNNGLDEKEQRYANTILQANANLELKFMEISAGEFSKDQLVDMGYYQDVIDCVCAYYDRLSAYTAAQQMREDTKIIVYLDEYYQSVLYMYEQRAIN